MVLSVLVIDVRCYIVLYYIILLLYYIIYYIIVLLYYILSYTILFSSDLFPSLPFLSHSSSILPILFSSDSKYTCRYLHNLIYILEVIPGMTIRPRMFYRSGWLRCVGFISMGIGLGFQLV